MFHRSLCNMFVFGRRKISKIIKAVKEEEKNMKGRTKENRAKRLWECECCGDQEKNGGKEGGYGLW